MAKREVATCIVLSVITCGIYGIYWFICLTDDVNQAIGETDVTGGTAFLFSLITCGIYGIYWAYKMGEKVNRAKSMRGLPVDPNAGILYLILSVFGFSIIALAIIQNDLNKVIDYGSPYNNHATQI